MSQIELFAATPWTLAAMAFGLAACAPAPQAAPSDALAASAAARSVGADIPSSTSTPPASAAASSASSALVASSVPVAPSAPSAGPNTSHPNCAEAEVSLDLRAWPTNHTVDVARESVYEASKFRGDAPTGVTVEVYPKPRTVSSVASWQTRRRRRSINVPPWSKPTCPAHRRGTRSTTHLSS